MKKIFLAVFVFMSVPFLTGCMMDAGSSPGYNYSPGYNGSYVSSTGYATSDYGLGFGADYSSNYDYGLGGLGDIY